MICSQEIRRVGRYYNMFYVEPEDGRRIRKRDTLLSLHRMSERGSDWITDANFVVSLQSPVSPDGHVVSFALEHPVWSAVMDVPQDQDGARNWMVELWHEYGARFDVFVPQEQPAPQIWEPIMQEPDKNGSSDPQIVKHWRMLDLTKRFLAERYSSFKILNSPSLRFDCLVPEFHKPVPIDPLQRQSHGWPEKTDPAAWYENSIRMGIFYWQVGFSCASSGMPQVAVQDAQEKSQTEESCRHLQPHCSV